MVANVLFGIFALIAYLASARESLGTFLGERSTKFGANAALYSVLFLGILVMANFLSARHFKRIDTTEAGVYSLSPLSAKYVKELNSGPRARWRSSRPAVIRRSRSSSRATRRSRLT